VYHVTLMLNYVWLLMMSLEDRKKNNNRVQVFLFLNGTIDVAGRGLF
jgi:Fe-S cluster biosynthesis and repair protein YggX